VLEGRALELHAGSAVLIPPNVAHELLAREPGARLSARFTLPGAQGSGDDVPVCAVQDLGPELGPVWDRFEQAIVAFSSRPAQAEAWLWDLLWELADRTLRSRREQPQLHVALTRACRVVHARLTESLTLADLARPAGVSPAHLTRLFRAELGITATDYLRRCRMERALQLLTRSELPIKEIACEVGIPDLHAFNKAVRRGYGVSPRELRARGLAPSTLSLRSAGRRPVLSSPSPAPLI
jgi:AraC-like DNA-binding protein